MENRGGEMPSFFARGMGLRWAGGPSERPSDQTGNFRGSARLVRVQFDIHRTRQIAAQYGRIVRLSADGSFSVKFDLPRVLAVQVTG